MEERVIEGAVPAVPDRATVYVPVVVLDGMVKDPVFVPEDCGLKVTVTAQVAPDTSAVGQLLLEEKSVPSTDIPMLDSPIFSREGILHILPPAPVVVPAHRVIIC